jgi:prolyl-tRNA synthetase
LRVQNKLEAVIDKHMRSIDAAKVSLSSITTEQLWKQSGRFSANSELFRLNDRRKSGFLLSPTHEEEITEIVGGAIKSYKDLPVRLYQVTRKYRDERRPRGGLLRGKEFLMKDLYTFDYSQKDALKTYKAVRQAYTNIFNELKIDYIVADADSGNMGGKLSHEYHYIHPNGEDKLWSCDSCTYVANEELAEHKIEGKKDWKYRMVLEGVSTDHSTRIELHISVPSPENYTKDDYGKLINEHAVKKVAENLGIDFATGLNYSTLQEALKKATRTVKIYDGALPEAASQAASGDITQIQDGDGCPKCSEGKLHSVPGIEVGHTFHLGTRYSEPLNAVVATEDNNSKVPVQMGCHGIGVSRLIGAAAACLHDSKGLNWPRAIAPFEAIIVPTPDIPEADIHQVYDKLQSAGIDVVLDDRADKGVGWKLKDADLIGYPVIMVLGRGWKDAKTVEIQCRRLGFKKEVNAETFTSEVEELLEQL